MIACSYAHMLVWLHVHMSTYFDDHMLIYPNAYVRAKNEADGLVLT